MEEIFKFYESNLIPYFKSKHADLVLRVVELEALALFQESKIKNLEEKIKQMENGAFLSNQDTAIGSLSNGKKAKKQKH